MPRDLTRPLVDELERLGVREWTIERGGKHHKLRFPANGRSQMLVFGNTTSDSRALADAKAIIRRMVRS